MLVEGDLPFVFVNRSTGLRILGVSPDPDPCVVPAPAVGTPTASLTIEAIFDGWGYVRLFATDIPRRGGTGSITQLDTYAIPEAQDPDYAVGFGDLAFTRLPSTRARTSPTCPTTPAGSESSSTAPRRGRSVHRRRRAEQLLGVSTSSANAAGPKCWPATATTVVHLRVHRRTLNAASATRCRARMVGSA